MYTQHTFVLKKLEKIFLLRLLTWCYYQPSLARTTPELIFMVSKVFEPLKFYCIWVRKCVIKDNDHKKDTAYGDVYKMAVIAKTPI